MAEATDFEARRQKIFSISQLPADETLIYALVDYRGITRYVGITQRPRFRRNVWNAERPYLRIVAIEIVETALANNLERCTIQALREWGEAGLNVQSGGRFVPCSDFRKQRIREGQLSSAKFLARRRFTEEQVRAIRESDERTEVLMMRYDCGRTAIERIKERETYANVA
jgi:hypothetical protein